MAYLSVDLLGYWDRAACWHGMELVASLVHHGAGDGGGGGGGGQQIRSELELHHHHV